MFGRIFGLDGRPVRAIANCGWSRYVSLTVSAEEPFRMNESIHGEKTASELQDELTEVTRHRAAISEVLRAIAGSPHDLQPIFDTILDSATRLCQAEVGSLRLSEQAGLRLVAVKGSLPWSPPELLEHSSYVGQFAASRSTVHIPDQAAHELYRRGDPYLLTTVNVWGFRTVLFVPMVKDEKVIGVLNPSSRIRVFFRSRVVTNQ
jgi:transcriptional regulator with GAF, ATPase, and Fis domain